jgi:hypothetical protein
MSRGDVLGQGLSTGPQGSRQRLVNARTAISANTQQSLTALPHFTFSSLPCLCKTTSKLTLTHYQACCRLALQRIHVAGLPCNFVRTNDVW